MSIKNRLMTYAEVLEHEPMKKHTTFKIGGCVDYYIYPKNCTALMCVLEILAQENIPYYVLGRGSNVLCSDTDFHGAIINLDRTLNDFYFEPDGVLVAQAGCSIINMAVEAMKRSLTGLEWASGIPGSIGGGLYMNAGAYGGEMSGICRSVTLMDGAGQLREVNARELEFSYRHSKLQESGEIVISAALQLQPAAPEEVKQKMRELQAKRLASQPLDYPSAGSAFKRPAGGYAAALIDQAGLRGFQVGQAAIARKHAGFAINLGGATAAEMRELLTQVSDRVFRQTGIRLEPEIRIW